MLATTKSFRTFLIGVGLTISVAACGGRPGGGGALPVPMSANDFMRSITPQSISPASVAIPPMLGLNVDRPSMSTRKPQEFIAALNFTQLDGSAVWVAASPDGTFWVLSTQGLPNGDKFIYHYVNGGFVNVPGAASRIAVGPDSTPWVINAAGGIYHLVNGAFVGIAGGASELSIGGTASAPLVDVISNQAPGPYGAGIYQYNVNAGSWSQLPGAGVTVAASIDSGTYPAININPGGFYVTNQVGGIYYYNVGIGFEQLPGGAIRLAPTASGGIFALGDPTNPVQHGIYYNDLSTGTWTQMPGAAVSISANSQDVYVIGAGGGIYVSPITQGTPPVSLAGTYLGKSSDSIGGTGYVGVNLVQAGSTITGTLGVLYANDVEVATLSGTVNGNIATMTLTPSDVGFCSDLITATLPATGQITSWTGTYSGGGCSYGTFSLTLASSVPSIAGTYNAGTVTSDGLSGSLQASISETSGGVLSGTWSSAFSNPANNDYGSLTGMVVASNAAVFYLVSSIPNTCPFGAAATLGTTPISGAYTTIPGTCTINQSGSFTLK